MSYNSPVESTLSPPFNLNTFIQQLELKRHADYATAVPIDEFPMGVIGLLNLYWEGDDKEQRVIHFDMQGQPLTFDLLSHEDREKRLQLGRSVKILEKNGKEIAHVTSIFLDAPENKDSAEFIAPQSVFSDPELTIVGETAEELESNTAFIRALLQGYLEYYNSLPKAEFVPREVKRYVKETSVIADGEIHPLFDLSKFPLPQKPLEIAAD